MASDKISITSRALIQRINRKLAPDEELRAAGKSDHVLAQTGEYYIVSRKEKRVMQRRVDLSALGRKLGVLDEWEVLAEQPQLRKRRGGNAA